MFGGAYLIAKPPNTLKLAKIVIVVLLVNITLGCLQVYSDVFAIFSNARLLAMRGTLDFFQSPRHLGYSQFFAFYMAGFYLISVKINV